MKISIEFTDEHVKAFINAVHDHFRDNYNSQELLQANNETIKSLLLCPSKYTLDPMSNQCIKNTD